MAFYDKIGLLILNEDKTRFLVCQKYTKNVTDDYIMPGGKNDEGDDFECLKNEIKQELNCEVDLKTLNYIGTYYDVASGPSGRDVEMKLYSGKIFGSPEPSAEIEKLHWIGAEAQYILRVSPIIRNKIIPDLLSKNIIKNQISEED